MDIAGNIAPAFLLTLIAGLSTGIGSAIAFFIKKPNIRYLCFTLGLSAGVMLYISFVELLPEALSVVGDLWGLYAFFAGIIVIGMIDVLIPDIENPHHYPKMEKNEKEVDHKLMRVGLFTALAITIHNFPEGIATFGSALVDVRLGILITFAIALHNIPEGISVSMPIFFATGDKKKAFVYSFLSGFSEPLGAVIGFLILMPFISDWILSFLLAFIAGIMVYISADELLPTAHQYGHGHCVIFGLIIGMFIMAVSLLFL
ncbi:MAG TPA: zinc transporter ZupT [Candidatus Thermoplasmatota archaeon]|nr:zinc transporter ZupT [Candidatus Thermoplasmatota archaeon]